MIKIDYKIIIYQWSITGKVDCTFNQDYIRLDLIHALTKHTKNIYDKPTYC